MPTRILLVDDHSVVAEGLRAMLAQEQDMEVVGIAEDGRTAVSMTRELSPDVVVIDIMMPQLNGIDATSQIIRDNSQVKILALSTYTDAKFVRSMLEAGAHGYVTKQTVATELLGAIRKIRNGRKYLSSDITETVVDGYLQPQSTSAKKSVKLGGREREVLQLIAEGATSGEVAAKLHISTNTVDTHRRNIMKKLDIHSIAELTKYAIREGLTNVEE